MSDHPFRSVTSESDWLDALDHSSEETVLIFKHSASCPVSGKANQEMEELAEEELLPIYRVVVQNSRSVSDEIASELDVRHETPQAILVNEQSSVFDTSHFNVTADTLREELRRQPQSTN